MMISMPKGSWASVRAAEEGEAADEGEREHEWNARRPGASADVVQTLHDDAEGQDRSESAGDRCAVEGEVAAQWRRQALRRLQNDEDEHRDEEEEEEQAQQEALAVHPALELDHAQEEGVVLCRALGNVGAERLGAFRGAGGVAGKFSFGEEQVDVQEEKEDERRAPVGQEALEEEMVGADAQEQRHADVYEQRAHLCGEGDEDERADDGEKPCRIAVAEVVPATHGRPQEDEQEQCERQADEEEGSEARREGEAFRRHGATCAEPGQDGGRRTHDERGKTRRSEHAADEVEDEEFLSHAPLG